MSTSTKKNVVVIGGGGREHAICYALSKSDKVGKIYALPGNDGMENVACYDIAADDIDGVTKFCLTHDIDLAVVAPDDPLALGMVDILTAKGIRAFGPTKAASKLEWSKAYSKNFMNKYNIPTAQSRTFIDYDQAYSYSESCPLPIVFKADGLALGKGVIIAQTREEAKNAVNAIMKDKAFGKAGKAMVVEQFLKGYEVSVLVFCDGLNFSVMPTSCDHKRALDGDKGLNTGGMGAYSPCPMFTKAHYDYTVERIIKPTVQGCISEGAPFKGVLYFGLMVDGDDVRVLEYNARFGDPETQIVLFKLKSDLYDIFNACIDGDLEHCPIVWDDRFGVCVVMASGGYPTEYKKGYPIKFNGEISKDAKVFYAGVKKQGDALVTNGGRVLCVSALATDGQSAANLAYDNIARIDFTDAHYRTDIYNPKK